MAITRTRQPEKKVFRNLPLALVWVSAIPALLVSPYSNAASWKIVPSLNLSESYTDNVNLASSGAKKDDFITQVNPGIFIAGTGSHLKAKLNYTMQNLARSRGGNSIDTNHQLNADAKAELIDHLFFLDGKAAISQQNISSFGAQPVDNLSNTGNRTSVTTYSISPYLRHNFGAVAVSELRYTRDHVGAQAGGFSDSNADNILFNLGSGASFRNVGWGLSYNKQSTDYSNNPGVETETYSGDVRFMISPKLSLTATGGHEKNNYLSTGVNPEGSFWTAGFSWTPTPRTSLAASAGERFFGKTHTFAASHRSRNTVWNMNYSESVTSTRSQFLIPETVNTADYLDQLLSSRITDPLLRQQEVALIIDMFDFPSSTPNNINYLTNRYFLQKQLQASVAIKSAKSTLVLGAFRTLRDAQTAQTMDSQLFLPINLAQNDNTKGIGGNAQWIWRITSRTNINVSAGYTENHSTSTGIKDKNRNMGIGLSRQIQPKINGSINYRHNERDSNQVGGNYRENAISASLNMTF